MKFRLTLGSYRTVIFLAIVHFALSHSLTPLLPPPPHPLLCSQSHHGHNHAQPGSFRPPILWSNGAIRNPLLVCILEEIAASRIVDRKPGHAIFDGMMAALGRVKAAWFTYVRCGREIHANTGQIANEMHTREKGARSNRRWRRWWRWWWQPTLWAASRSAQRGRP